MADEEISNEDHYPIIRAISPSALSHISNRSKSSRRSSPFLERTNTADLKSTLLEALQLSNPEERIGILKDLKDCVQLFEMQITVDNQICASTNDANSDNQKWKTVKTFKEFDHAEAWLKQNYEATVKGYSRVPVFQDSLAMVNMVTKSNRVVYTWKRYSCKKEPYYLKILYQDGNFYVQESIATHKRTNPIEAEETAGASSSDTCLQKRSIREADEVGVPFELQKSILFMYNNQCQPKNISDKLKYADDDQLMELFQSEETVQVSTYNHFLLNCFYVTIFILLGH